MMMTSMIEIKTTRVDLTLVTAQSISERLWVEAGLKWRAEMKAKSRS